MIKKSYKSSISGTIRVPSSKSYAQRSLAAALLSKGESTLGNVTLCDDTKFAMGVICKLGATTELISDYSYRINGGLNPKSKTINIGESGLAARLFTPITALYDKEMTIKGRGSILKRPMDIMFEPLSRLGVEVKSDGYLPIKIKGPIRGGEVDVDGSISSQFLTGLLMTLPMAQEETTLHVSNLKSIPYIDMTLDVADRFGIKIDHHDYTEFYIAGAQEYTPASYDIEGDWSSAAFFLVAGAIAGQITVTGMNLLSMQADKQILNVLSHQVGSKVTTLGNTIAVSRNNLNPFEFDATHCPDLFPILAVLAANCEGVSKIKGVLRLTHKESDRAKAILSEFSKLGIKIDINDDVMTITGGNITGGRVDPHNDHRIAMAAAIAGLTSSSPVTILQSESVSKSYPNFWSDFESVISKK